MFFSKNNIRHLLTLTLFVFLFVELPAQVSPDIAFGELFKEVQLEPVFPDSKTFPDCIPIYSPEEIMEKYQEQKENEGFDLKSFVLENFQLPDSPSSGFQSDTSMTVEEHITQLWPILTRKKDASSKGSLIALPNPYIVPGGRFREIYYWDSYFTMLGLQVSGEDDMIENMVNNFTFLLDSLGFIPNGNRTYYLSRSQPPFYALMVELLADIRGDSTYIKYLPAMQKEYAFWMDGAEQLSEDRPSHRRVVLLDGKFTLNRYWDDRPTPRPEAYKEDYQLAQKSDTTQEILYRNLRAACESGWDFSSRWLKDGRNLNTIHTTDIIPVDLNSLLYNLEMTIAKAFELKKDSASHQLYLKKAGQRKEAVRKYCWNENQHFYMDYDFVEGKTTSELSLAAAYPLYFNISSAFEARQVASKLEERFLKDGGLNTTLQNTGQQWDSPNGWPPLQYMSIQGLYRHGLEKLADAIKTRWIDNNIRVYENTGKMVEKYNVTDITLEAGGGEYPVQDGFGWTNGVFLRLNEEEVRP